MGIDHISSGSSTQPVLIKIDDKKQRENEHHPEVRALAEDKCGGGGRGENAKTTREMQIFPPHSKEKNNRVCEGHELPVYRSVVVKTD